MAQLLGQRTHHQSLLSSIGSIFTCIRSYEFESSTFKPQFNFTCLLSLILTFIWSYRRSIWNQFRHAAVGVKIIANGKAQIKKIVKIFSFKDY